MRTRFLAAFAVCIGLSAGLPGSARAQEEDETQPEEGQEAEQEASETEGADVVEPGQVAVPRGGREAAPGEVHNVVRGDTLWDLSQRYLGNAWYWPKVWSYNPEIANPHWIYPGNLVRFFPGEGEEAPTQVETGEGPPQVAEQPQQPGGVRDITGDIEPGSEFTADEPSDEVIVVGRIGARQPSATTVLRDQFVTPREIEEAGRITGSFTESLMLSGPSQIYVKFARGEARVGDRYMIFRTDREIDHPTKGGRYGFVTKVVGVARVVRGGPTATLRIEDTWDEIGRGDLLGPYGESLMAQVASKPASRTVDAVVLAPTVSHVTMAAEHYTVFVDKGSADGVEVGNEFVMMRRGDFGGQLMNPSKDGSDEFPWEDIAICMVVDVKETASSCLIKRSLREIVAGDRAQMRAATGGSVSAR